MSAIGDDNNDSLENFQLQVDELEMLQSAYCNPGEFVLDDPGALADINSYLEIDKGQRSCPPPPSSRLMYTVHLKTDEVSYEVCCAFPRDYPVVRPEIYVRSPGLSRESQCALNADLTAAVADMEPGELCVGPALQWLRDHGMGYLGRGTDHRPPVMPAVQETGTACGHLRRYWIYSHHIYNKTKRRNILEYAKDYDVTGFCLPGKPGIICVEGAAPNCADFWHRIKQMTWKKIVCVKEENEEDVNVGRELFCRFETFKELAFGSGSGHHARMDMGEFFGYLDRHKCGYAFKDYFGFDGKASLA